MSIPTPKIALPVTITATIGVTESLEEQRYTQFIVYITDQVSDVDNIDVSEE